MKRTILALVIAATAVVRGWGAESESAPTDSRIRLGILQPEVRRISAKEAESFYADLMSVVADLGFYTVSTQEDLENFFSQVKIDFPQRCRDPRCVLDVGRTTNMERMLYGSLDKNKKTYGVVLSLLDINSRQVIETVSLKGDAGIKVRELFRAAVNKLHGHVDEELDIKTDTYYGPEVYNQKEWAISSAATLGLGFIWALASGALSSSGEEPAWLDDYANADLSGKPSSPIHIPLFGRPASMANSYLAVSDDAYGVFFNPAGLSWIAGREAVLGYQSRFRMLNNVAASYVNRATREIGFGQAFFYSGDTENLQSDVYFTSAAAYKFHHLLPFLRPISVGLALRLGSRVTPEKKDATSSQKTFSLGTDLGLMWELTDKIRYGMVLRDLLAFDKVNNTLRGYDYVEYQPVTLNMGGSFRVGYATLLVANGQLPVYEDQTWKMAGGIEQEMFGIMRIRAGVEKEIQAEFMKTAWKITGGLGAAVVTENLFGNYVNVDLSYEYNTASVFPVVNTSLLFGF